MSRFVFGVDVDVDIVVGQVVAVVESVKLLNFKVGPVLQQAVAVERPTSGSLQKTNPKVLMTDKSSLLALVR